MRGHDERWGFAEGRRLLPSRLPSLRGGDRAAGRPARRGIPLRTARDRHRERRPAAAPPPGEDPGGRGRRDRRLRACIRRRGRAGQTRYCGGMADVIDEIQAAGLPVEGERLSLGVAARLSRYLQVLTQARKMGRETISSQELSEYTHINP